MVNAGDLKPDPVLWHEDSGRRPWENDRRNPLRNISGRQLGEASHRLVANSLQLKADHNGYANHSHAPSRPDAARPYAPPQASYSNGLYDPGRHRTRQSRTDYSHAGQHRPFNPTYYDHAHGQSLAVPVSKPYYSGSRPPFERENRSNGQHSRQVYHQPNFHHNGPQHPHGSIAETAGAYGYQSEYDGYQSHQPPRDSGHQQWRSRFPPPVDQNVPRGYNHNQQRGSRYSVVDARGSRGLPGPGTRGVDRRPPQQHPHGGVNRRPQYQPRGGLNARSQQAAPDEASRFYQEPPPPGYGR